MFFNVIFDSTFSALDPLGVAQLRRGVAADSRQPV